MRGEINNNTTFKIYTLWATNLKNLNQTRF
jgi:hypothetical protein